MQVPLFRHGRSMSHVAKEILLCTPIIVDVGYDETIEAEDGVVVKWKIFEDVKVDD